MVKTNTWLPIFSGFYNTIWESNDDLLECNLKEDCEEKGYSQEKIDEILDFTWCSKHYSKVNSEYRVEITKDLTKEIERLLKEMEMVHKIVYQEVASPKEYNFINDGVNIEIQLRSKHVNNLKEYLLSNWNNWSEYLKERYTSCDGFMSYHDSYPESEQWIIDNIIEHEHRLGSLLNFILLNEHAKSGERDTLEYDLYCEIQGDNSCSVCLESLEKEMVTKETA